MGLAVDGGAVGEIVGDDVVGGAPMRDTPLRAADTTEKHVLEDPDNTIPT